jgi:hypothetical protein
MTSSLRYDENDSFELGADDLTAYGEWRGCCPALSQIPGRERLDVGWRDGRNRVIIQAAPLRHCDLNLTGRVCDRMRNEDECLVWESRRDLNNKSGGLMIDQAR